MHYFMFTDHDYDYHDMFGLYICDHEVSYAEYLSFYESHRKMLHDKEQELMLQWFSKRGYGLGWQGGSDEPERPVYVIFSCQDEFSKSEEGKALYEFKQKNVAHKSFISAHNMREVPVMELWV